MQQRIEDNRERQRRKREVAAQVHEKRRAIAKLKQHYDRYQAQQKSRGLARRNREELVFKHAFEDSVQEYRMMLL